MFWERGIAPKGWLAWGFVLSAVALIACATSQESAPTEGWVRLRFNIDRKGRVQHPRVVEASHPAFVKGSLRTIRKWKYKPNKPARGVVVRLDFELNEDAPSVQKKGAEESQGMAPEFRDDEGPVDSEQLD